MSHKEQSFQKPGFPGSVSRAAGRSRQLPLFADYLPDARWKQLSTKRLPLTEEKYAAIRKCYREVYESFLPGSASVPFYTQVSNRLLEEGVDIRPRSVARLVSDARAQGIEDFPDPGSRTVKASSVGATKLQNPAGSLRMSVDEHNAFAEVYRTLMRTWRKSKSKSAGKGFFAQAAAEMRDRGYSFTEKQLTTYAHYRRRIGDINFPRLRGSQDIERMQIAAVERNRALGVMATGLMHEILQPLQVIQSTAEHQRQEIEKGVVDRSQLLDRLDRVVTQARLINEVVQHVRTIARAGEIRAEAVTLHPSIERSLTLFQEQLRSRGIEVDLSGVSPDLPAVSADQVALERIFINLVTNARDAIEETGRKTGIIRFSAHETETAIVCEVADNGTGINEANLERIFDPYFTTKQVGKGTGMGLAEVFNAMIQFGGKITAANNSEQGATFRLEFKKHARIN